MGPQAPETLSFSLPLRLCVYSGRLGNLRGHLPGFRAARGGAPAPGAAAPARGMGARRGAPPPCHGVRHARVRRTSAEYCFRRVAPEPPTSLANDRPLVGERPFRYCSYPSLDQKLTEFTRCPCRLRSLSLSPCPCPSLHLSISPSLPPSPFQVPARGEPRVPR